MGLLKPTEDMTTMKERPTPETDALAGDWIACECVPVSHSRKLERERDEALARLDSEKSRLRGAMARLCRAVSRRMISDVPTPEDRMELREAFDAASSVLHNDKDHATDGARDENQPKKSK